MEIVGRSLLETMKTVQQLIESKYYNSYMDARGAVV